MSDHVVDTNVLIVASAHDPGSPFPPGETHVPAAEKRVVFDWLRQFRKDSGSMAVLDFQRGIYGEYRNKLKPMDYGILAIVEKIQRGTVRYVNVAYDRDGNAVLPDDLAAAVTDLADRKMVAAVLADDCHCTIVNAAETDWYDIEATLQSWGVRVDDLIGTWNREVHRLHLQR